jgi:hypothetical protein
MALLAHAAGSDFIAYVFQLTSYRGYLESTINWPPDTLMQGNVFCSHRWKNPPAEMPNRIVLGRGEGCRKMCHNIFTVRDGVAILATIFFE